MYELWLRQMGRMGFRREGGIGTYQVRVSPGLNLLNFPSIDIHRRYENGINTFDTANVYSNGESERILGKALKAHSIPRENLVIMTKVRVPLRRRTSSAAHEDPRSSMVWFGTMTARLF